MLQLNRILLFAISFLGISILCNAQVNPVTHNQKIDGYKGIWFTLGQFSEYGDKYSGGLNFVKLF